MTTGWEVSPQALTDMLVWVQAEYGDIPLYVTENGAAFYDPPCAVNGAIDDPLRVDYLRTHIAAVGEAIARGVDVRGYMLWSLRSEEHTSELQSLMRISYAVFCLKKKKKNKQSTIIKLVHSDK